MAATMVTMTMIEIKIVVVPSVISPPPPPLPLRPFVPCGQAPLLVLNEQPRALLQQSREAIGVDGFPRPRRHVPSAVTICDVVPCVRVPFRLQEKAGPQPDRVRGAGALR